MCCSSYSLCCFTCQGVDFQIKTMCIDGRCFALQLWDTAGQERCVHKYSLITSVEDQAVPLLIPFCFYYIFTSSVSYNWTNMATQNLFLNTIDVIYDLFGNRRTTTWNLFHVCFWNREHFSDHKNATYNSDRSLRHVTVAVGLFSYHLLFLSGRFRSITKQYFRKADGVIVFYDITMETSYLNIKNWMISVEVLLHFASRNHSHDLYMWFKYDTVTREKLSAIPPLGLEGYGRSWESKG